MQAHIKTHSVLDKTTAKVGAVINHGFDKPSVSEIAASLSNATANKLNVLTESIRVLQADTQQMIVTAAMKVTKDVLPFEQATEFTSVSAASNVYMDTEENIWSLQQTDGQKVFVRSSISDDPAEIESLLSSCSNVTDETRFSRDKDALGILQSVSNAAAQELSAADIVAFAHDGKVELGCIVSISCDGAGNQLDEFHILPYGDNEVMVTLSSNAVIQNFGELPDEVVVEDPVMASCSSADVEKLVSYYRKVYGHNAAFFQEFEKRIRSHQFCN